MRFQAAWAVLACGLAGCGYPGDPLPPALNIPERITDLRALQRGARLIVSLTAPVSTTDKLILKRLPAIELFAGPAPAGDFNADAWAATAELVTREPGDEPALTIELPAPKWAGREVVLGARAIGPTGRRSAWSNLVVVPVLAPLAPPQGLRASATPEGVQLEWDAGGASLWRVFRQAPGEESYVLLGRAASPSWLDRTASFGQRYTYQLQAAAPAGELEAESEPGEPLIIEPRDTFPPAAPAGFTAIAGVNSIELAWERSPEPDFSAYQLFRAEADAPLAPFGDPLSALSFSDTNIVSGRRYRYALAARDHAGNLSPLTAPIEITAP
jgi:hypothetical protein